MKPLKSRVAALVLAAPFVPAALLVLATLTGGPLQAATTLDGEPVQLATGPEDISVLVFVDTLCPIANRYAPELQRLLNGRDTGGLELHVWMVYPNVRLSPVEIASHMAEYGLPGTPVIDTDHSLVDAADVSMTPETAVFRGGERLYHGRIDDRFTGYGSKRRRAKHRELDAALLAAVEGTLPAKASEPFVGAGCFIADFRRPGGHLHQRSHVDDDSGHGDAAPGKHAH